MKFRLAAPAIEAPGLARYFVELRVMHGDADSYETLYVGPFSPMDEAALADLVETLRRVDAARPQGEDGYKHVEGFRAWFDDDYDGAAENDPHTAARNAMYDDIYTWWPLHPYAPYPGQLDKFKVVWYDSYGYKFDVDIED